MGNPLRLLLTAGNINDITPACGLIEGLAGSYLLADRAYDANKFIELGLAQKQEIVIPPTKRRLIQREYDKHIYKERHLVECFFAKLKSFRGVATRYNKLAVSFKAAVMIAACLIWLQ